MCAVRLWTARTVERGEVRDERGSDRTVPAALVDTHSAAFCCSYCLVRLLLFSSSIVACWLWRLLLRLNFHD